MAKEKTEEEWKRCLSTEQYRVLREKGTELPFTGALTNNKKAGTYACAGCGSVLFKSSEKFESGTGWPSFFDAASSKAVEKREDNSLGMRRTEVVCAKCKGHLGHLFDDGPAPTGLRYCINSAALSFRGRE